MTPQEKMTRLAGTLPSMRDRIGAQPFDAEVLRQQMGYLSSGEILAAQFLLAVWNSHNEFSVMRALTTWDEAHCAAFVAWAKDPWWC